MPAKGCVQSLETRMRISQSKIGHTVSLETREKISKTLKKNPVRFWLGKKFEELHKVKLSKSHKSPRLWSRETKSPHWKGDKVGYMGLHRWVRMHLGKPSICEHCGNKDARKYEWANKSGKYLRDLTDWLRLCKPCHKKYDNV